MNNLPKLEESNTLYLVYLSTGEYEDYTEKNIGVFSSQDRAIDIVNQYNKYFEDNQVSPENKEIADYNTRDILGETIGFFIDYTGVSARMKPVKLLK